MQNLHIHMIIEMGKMLYRDDKYYGAVDTNNGTEALALSSTHFYEENGAWP